MTDHPEIAPMRECPNPWCGSTEIIRVSTADETVVPTDGAFCMCVHCGVQSPAAPTEAEAIAAWNTRPREDALREALEALIDRTPHRIECLHIRPASEWMNHGSNRIDCVCGIEAARVTLMSHK